MGQIQTYCCDKCGHTQSSDRKFSDSDRWMKTIVLGVKDGFQHVDGNIRFGFSDTVESVLWCDQCLGDFGVTRLVLRQPANDPPPPAPTLDDIIRDIVAQKPAEAGIES